MTRLHAGGTVGQASADVLATWPPGTPLADIEEAIKVAAREAVHRARDSDAGRG